MKTDIFVLIKAGDVKSIEKLLLEAPLLINAKEPIHKSSPLHYAIHFLQTEVVKLFADHIEDINVKDGLGRTCIHYTSWEGLYDFAKILINSGADVNVREGSSGDGKTPLHRAAENGHLEMVNLLLKNGADPELTIPVRCYKPYVISEEFPDFKWKRTPKDCASTKAIRQFFQQYEGSRE